MKTDEVCDHPLETFARAKDAKSSFLDGVLAGMFTVPGDGGLDYAAIMRALKAIDYSGWIVIEAEQDSAGRDPFHYQSMGLDALKRMAREAGLDGVVCSPLEAALVKEACGQDFLTVTPGIRFADGDVGDQVRVMTPAKARLGGSDYIVVGRPITAAADPVAAYERCVKEFLGE